MRSFRLLSDGPPAIACESRVRHFYRHRARCRMAAELGFPSDRLWLLLWDRSSADLRELNSALCRAVSTPGPAETSA